MNRRLMTRDQYVIEPEERYLPQFSCQQYAWAMSDENNSVLDLDGYNAAGILREIQTVKNRSRETVYLFGKLNATFVFRFSPREEPWEFREVEGGVIVQIGPNASFERTKDESSDDDDVLLLSSDVAIALLCPENLVRNWKSEFETDFHTFSHVALYPTSGRLDFH